MHFFIDPTKLESQTAEQAFGPENTGTTGDPVYTEKFKITSQFKLKEEARAYACCSGRFIIQQSDIDSSLVNVLIKPDVKNNNNTLGIFLPVTWIVYRGIKKNSFLSEEKVIPKDDTTTNAIVTAFWKQLNIKNTDIKSLGYSNEIASPTTTPLFKLLDSKEVDSTTSGQKVRVSANLTVTEGDWIGTFGTSHTIGIEIYLGLYTKPMLSYFRGGKYSVDVSGSSGQNKINARQDIFSYIDPVAYFGLFFGKGIFYSTPTINKQPIYGASAPDRPGTPSLLHETLFSKFATANRVYIYIQNESGNAYNHDQIYKDPAGKDIKVGLEDVDGTADVFGKNEWPVEWTDESHTTTNTESQLIVRLIANSNRTGFIETNQTDLFYNTKMTGWGIDSKGTVIKSEVDHLIDKDLNLSEPWTKPIYIKHPNYGNQAQRLNIPYYCRFKYANIKCQSDAIVKSDKFTETSIPNLQVKLQDLNFRGQLGSGLGFSIVVKGVDPNAFNAYDIRFLQFGNRRISYTKGSDPTVYYVQQDVNSVNINVATKYNTYKLSSDTDINRFVDSNSDIPFFEYEGGISIACTGTNENGKNSVVLHDAPTTSLYTLADSIKSRIVAKLNAEQAQNIIEEEFFDTFLIDKTKTAFYQISFKTKTVIGNYNSMTINPYFSTLHEISRQAVSGLPTAMKDVLKAKFPNASPPTNNSWNIQ